MRGERGPFGGPQWSIVLLHAPEVYRSSSSVRKELGPEKESSRTLRAVRTCEKEVRVLRDGVENSNVEDNRKKKNQRV